MSLIIPETLRLQLRAASGETRAALAEMQLARTLLLAHIEKIDTDGTLKKLMRSANDSVALWSSQQSKLQALLEDVKKAIGVASLDTFEMDMDTGELREKGNGEEALQAASAG